MTLNMINTQHNNAMHYAECHYAECHYAECHYAECHYAECRYTECHASVESHFQHACLEQTLSFFAKGYSHR
jgi:hypothetical protein